MFLKKLGFVYVPVQDFKKALTWYRDELGLDEAWREGELAAGFALPGTDVGLMIDRDQRESQAGPFFLVDDVVAFHGQNTDRFKFVAEPREIPPGMYASFEDPSGNVIRVMDNSKERA